MTLVDYLRGLPSAPNLTGYDNMADYLAATWGNTSPPRLTVAVSDTMDADNLLVAQQTAPYAVVTYLDFNRRMVAQQHRGSADELVNVTFLLEPNEFGRARDTAPLKMLAKLARLAPHFVDEVNDEVMVKGSLIWEMQTRPFEDLRRAGRMMLTEQFRQQISV